MRHFALRGADDTLSNGRAGWIYVQTIYYAAEAWTPGDTQYILDARTGQVLWQLTVKVQIAEEIDRHSGEVVFLQGDDTTHSMLSILDGRTGAPEAHVRLPYKASSVRVSARLGRLAVVRPRDVLSGHSVGAVMLHVLDRHDPACPPIMRVRPRGYNRPGGHTPGDAQGQRGAVRGR